MFSLPADVKYIINRLTEYGFEAYAVGGCVRDSILHREPGDWDITTSALPYQVKSIFKRTVDTGIKHGTVTVMMDKVGYEVTTYRIDGEYEDKRHPKSVEFTSLLSEDLKRRDFTINAMAFNEEQGMVDLFHGMEDIENKIIRCVGDPKERFTEDALRMLRAVRFAAQLGFTIEEKTKAAITELAPTIFAVSKERIHTEFNKTLLSGNPDYILMAKELGITAVIFPEFDKAKEPDIISKLLKALPKELIFKYAALLYELGDKECHRILKELKLDNYTVINASDIVKGHGLEISSDEYIIRKQAASMGPDNYSRVLVFEKEFYRIKGLNSELEGIEKQEVIFNSILERGDCLSLKELAVTGNDLIKMGVKPGKEMGMILNNMLEEVLEHPEHNTKEFLYEKI